MQHEDNEMQMNDDQLAKNGDKDVKTWQRSVFISRPFHTQSVKMGGVGEWGACALGGWDRGLAF